jgi:outer membrane protein assembly factor BamD (BamD/ComL family)
VAEARAQLAARPHDTVLHLQLHNLLVADPAAGGEMLAHAREFIAVLVNQRRGEQAFSILKTCLGRDPAFKPEPDHILPLANLAQAHGDALTALRLMHEFDRRHPNHPATAGIYYLSARVLRGQNKLAAALRILDLMLQRFPSDPLIPQARSMRDAVARLAST